MKFHEGDEVRALVTDRDMGIFEGELYVVEFAYDDVPDMDETLYALPRGEALESQLELVRTWDQMAARRLPAPLDLIKAMGPHSWRDYETGLDVNETDIGGETEAIEFFGKTGEGLPFGARMEVTRIWHADY